LGAVDADAAVAADTQHIPEAEGFELGAQVGVDAIDLIAIDLITGDPPGRQPGLDSTRDHRGGQCGFGGELDLLGHPGRRRRSGSAAQLRGR
jgi:hypothetical protein